MEAYINGIGAITSQEFILDSTKWTVPIIDDCAYNCKEPDYHQFLDPATTRRMSGMIKMGLCASKICLADSKVEQPDAIIVGTGLGCIEDTNKFLKSIFDFNEEFLAPTSFIQSTHNTISAQIALMLKNHNYNFTYVHGAFSFESALLDSIMMLQEENFKNILLGGIEELTPILKSIFIRTRFCKTDNSELPSYLNSKTKGSIISEGTVFFTLSQKKSATSYAKIRAVETLYNPDSIDEVAFFIKDFIATNHLNYNEIDLVLLGLNSDVEDEKVYQQIVDNCFIGLNLGYFKHLCGEYFTASSFAMAMAAIMIKEKNVPEVIKINQFESKKLNNILIYNHYKNKNHSLMLLSAH